MRLDAAGAVVLRRRAKRETVIALAAKLSPCIVGMEDTSCANHLGRGFAARGHEVRLVSPEYVRPCVKAQKNDDRDAELERRPWQTLGLACRPRRVQEPRPG